MNKIFTKHYKTELGELILGATDQYLCICDWSTRKNRTAVDNRIKKTLNGTYIEKETEIIKKAKKQIDEYISGKRKKFNVPFKTTGTDFQKKVWDELCRIPYGKTESYQGISERINNKKAVRAVSSAIGANALSLIIPCHRIIGTNGTLTGYAGGLAAKKTLLKIESKNINSWNMLIPVLTAKTTNFKEK